MTDDATGGSGPAPDSPDDGEQRPPGGGGENDSDTRSAARRHWLTNDAAYFLTTAMVAGMLAGFGTGWLDPTSLPPMLVEAVLLVYVAANTWAFGVALLDRWLGGSG